MGEILIRQIKSGAVTQVVFENRVYAKTVTVIEITVIFQVLQEQVDSESRAVVEVEVLVQLSRLVSPESIDASIDHSEIFADLTFFRHTID